jgi:dipeptidase
LNKGDKKAALLTTHSNQLATNVIKDWWALSERLYIRYNDGYLNTPDGIAQAVFYPAWWLKQVGYEQGPASYTRPADRR